MTTVVCFPGGTKGPVARPVSREELEQLAEMSLDMVERIVAILNSGGGGPEIEAGDDPVSLGTPHVLRFRPVGQKAEE